MKLKLISFAICAVLICGGNLAAQNPAGAYGPSLSSASGSFPVVSPTNAKWVFDGDSRWCGTNATYSPACSAEPYTIPSGGFIVSTTGSPIWGSATLSVANGASTVNGMNVVGAGIGPGTTIQSGGGTNTLTLSSFAASTPGSVTIKFGATDIASQTMQSPAIAATSQGYNLGISGQTCTQILARYPTDAHILSPAVTGIPAYFVPNCGTNDEGPTSTPTATGTNGQSTIVVSAVTGIDIGTPVTGTGIGASAVVANTWNGTSTTIPLTVPNSGTVSGTATFTTSAAVISNVTAAIWALAKADGYKVIATTNPNHGTQSVTRNLNTTYNATIQSGKGNAYDYLANLKLKLNNTYDFAYFSSTDQTHFTNLGYQVGASTIIGAVINSNADALTMPFAPLITVPGSGSGNFACLDTDLYGLITGTGDTVCGYGSAPLATSMSFSAIVGDNNLTACTTCTTIDILGHGLGNNLLTAGGSDVLLGGDVSGDFSFAVSAGIGCSVTGSSGVCIGHNATAGASAFALGGGSTASAAGAVEIDSENASTNSVAHSFNYENQPMAGHTTFSVAGCGTATSLTGFSLVGQFTGGSATCTPVVTTNLTAPHGYSCTVQDQTTSTAAFRQTASTTTTVTFTAGGTVGATDVINFNCGAF